MTDLSAWTRSEFSADGTTHPTYRRGAGPGVVIVHELPGMTPEVIGFADEVVDAGFTVVMPHRFGRPGARFTAGALAGSLLQVCISREFNLMRLQRTSPVASWLRALARELHSELGGRGVGALGMCLTGGFALAMMVEPAVAAPVVAQPSLPFPVGRRRAADLNLSAADLAAVQTRAAAGCPVLGVAYTEDPAVGTRFDTLRESLGRNFLSVPIPGRGHATLTAQRSAEAVTAVLEFFTARLSAE